MSQVWTTAAPPVVEFGSEGVHRTLFLVHVAMDGHRFPFFPPLDRADIPLEIGRDVLPGIQAVCGVCVRRVEVGGSSCAMAAPW